MATTLTALRAQIRAVLANTTFGQWADTELIATNFPITPNGQLVDWHKALQYLENEFGLLPIQEEAQP